MGYTLEEVYLVGELREMWLRSVSATQSDGLLGKDTWA